MQLPEFLLERSIIIQLLNTLGLGILAGGVIVYYRALLARSDTLKNSLNDLKSAHETVVSTMEKRAKEIDARFDDEKKFRSLRLSLLEEVEIYRIKVKAWKDDELSILQNKLKEVSDRLEKVEAEYGRLKIENQELTISLAHLETKCKFLETQNKNLEVELGFAKPGVKGVA